jgi:hypothetical protein
MPVGCGAMDGAGALLGRYERVLITGLANGQGQRGGHATLLPALLMVWIVVRAMRAVRNHSDNTPRLVPGRCLPSVLHH